MCRHKKPIVQDNTLLYDPELVPHDPLSEATMLDHEIHHLTAENPFHIELSPSTSVDITLTPMTPAQSRAHLEPQCTVYSDFCSVHNFCHGAEAEELREGIEAILKEDYEVDEYKTALTRLLERVDARDSLAYLEAKKQEDTD